MIEAPTEQLTYKEIPNTLILREYDSATGEVVRDIEIPDMPRYVKVYSQTNTNTRATSGIDICNMVTTNNCLLYIAVGNGIVVYDLQNNKVCKKITLLNQPMTGDVEEIPPYSFPPSLYKKDPLVAYYGSQFLTKDNVWWGYAQIHRDLEDHFSDTAIFSFDGNEVKLYPFPVGAPVEADLYDYTSTLSVIDNRVIYGTNYGISELVINPDEPIGDLTGYTPAVTFEQDVHFVTQEQPASNDYGSYFSRPGHLRYSQAGDGSTLLIIHEGQTATPRPPIAKPLSRTLTRTVINATSNAE